MAKRVVVGMSGGVDSSVAAWLLKSQGYEVIGVFMKNWEDDDDDAYCSTRQDWLDAVSVADRIGIEIEPVNFAAEYKTRVFDHFLREYAAGRTPNPDILCNTEIKFSAFLDFATQLGADHIATGHYARTAAGPEGATHLLRACDESKDQSYFLHRLTQAQLCRALFPLGEMQKTEVRALAQHLGLANHAKKDSTGICFIGERPFREFLNRYLPTAPGPMITPEGHQIGTHQGLAFYTLGQRKGLGIGGVALPAEQAASTRAAPNASGAESGPEASSSLSDSAWYVAQKNIDANTLVVVRGHHHPLLYTSCLQAQAAHWIGLPPDVKTVHGAKTRYRQADAACHIERDDAQGLSLRFMQPQFAVTPGQSVVLYEGERCLGGAVIEMAIAD